MNNSYLFKMLLLGICLTMCQNESEEPNIPMQIEIFGSSPSSFTTVTGQELKFILVNETLYAKVLEIDNQLCPDDPGGPCIAEGYLIAAFRLTNELESDTVMLRHGEHSYPDFWSVSRDSVTTTLSRKSYRLYLLNVIYYSNELTNKKEELKLTMQLKKL